MHPTRCLALALLAAAAQPQDAPPRPPAVARPLPADVEWLDQPPPEAAALAANPAAFAELLDKNGLSLDIQGGTLAVRGSVLHDEQSLGGYPVEYLVVTERGRTHEALILVRAQPALVDACLRALGLAPGSSMHSTPKEPPPTAEELAAGADPWEVVPAAGELVDVRLAWTGADGAPRSIPLESALLDVRTGQALPQRDWVYTGGGFGPLRAGRRVLQTFLADAQGDIVGISPMDRGGEGVCVLERNSPDGADDSLYQVDGATAPPRGTAITLLLRPTGARTAPATGPQPEVVVTGELGARLDAWLTRLTAWGFSGTVMVERGAEVLLHKGYGLADRERGTPVTTATAWPFSSICKQFTAAAILQLEAAGKLKLDDSIADHLDGVPEDKYGITLRMLLGHTSGLPIALPQPTPDSPTLIGDRRATVSAILALPLQSAPGAQFSYSNLGYALLAAVVESAADDIFRGYLGEHVFQPAAMTSAGLFGEPRWSADRLARGYTGAPGAQQPAPQPANGPLTWERVGAGAVVCTVRDLSRWVHALTAGTILPPPQLATMFTPGLGDYGCAWWIIDGGAGRGRLAWHDGLLAGYRSEVRRYLDHDVTIIVADNSEMEGVAAPLADIAFGGELPRPPAVGALDAAAATAIAGTWGAAEGPHLDVRAPAEDPGALWAVPLDQAALDLLDGADAATRQARGKYSVRTLAFLVAVANARWDECAGTLGPDATAAQCEATFGPWWKHVGEGLGAAVQPRVVAAGSERGRMAVDVELQFAQGVAKRRIFWQDGELTDIRIPAGPLGARRCLPAADGDGLWRSWRLEEGAGPSLQARAAADGTRELAILPQAGEERVLRRAP
ncbi:MAG TPA: serine hydrolase [Planctomycetota bacterium]|nr:serine hydrolase [Planctomycetota bacterium]